MRKFIVDFGESEIEVESVPESDLPEYLIFSNSPDEADHHCAVMSRWISPVWRVKYKHTKTAARGASWADVVYFACGVPGGSWANISLSSSTRDPLHPHFVITPPGLPPSNGYHADAIGSAEILDIARWDG